MNTPAKAPLAIKASFIGPVLSLSGDLTKNNQNLVFARNGTGKSFLSRALRYLDLTGQNRPIPDAAVNLVSDESEDGKGSFYFLRGTTALGTLALAKGGPALCSVGECIFHVFSEDFVQEELREQRYELDGKIENEIAVDGENIKLEAARTALDSAIEAELTAHRKLANQYEVAKSAEIQKKAGVNRQLREYRALTLDALLEKFPKKPTPVEKLFVEILKDLDSLKAIPSEPKYPDKIAPLSVDDLDLLSLGASLDKVTSPSSVSTEIRKKIDAHHSFYEHGAKIVRDEHRTSCPFCEQSIGAPSPKSIIDAYLTYFEDEEEKHKSVLRDFFRKLRQKEILLDSMETNLSRLRMRYDDLKQYLPSKKDTSISDWHTVLANARTALTEAKSKIEQKAASLASSVSLSAEDLILGINALNGMVAEINEKVDDLTQAVEKADEERKSLQRKACLAFELEFAASEWSIIDDLRGLRMLVLQRQEELSALEKLSPSSSARDRVAATFELLLQSFFGKKYVFDKTSFTLKRGEKEMTRGPHRTLSDGEKTAIAFCYFIACAHKKVQKGSDYRRLFLVFDDPITSMSYDFIFEIAQTLKNLNFSEQGDISNNPSRIDGKKCWRPDLLILTHSSYFFNISITNKVVEENAAFALHSSGAQHSFVPLSKYVAPFQQQLIDVHEVANGKDPDHRTASSVRSVLEAIGRFCRPDKSDSLTNFVKHLAGEQKIVLKSVLINSLCHGTYYEETPPPDDLVAACKETIDVVALFAPGQLELIRAK